MTLVLSNITKGVDMNYLGWNINSSLDGMFPILTANLPYNTELDENDEVQLKEGTNIKFGGYISKIEQDERGLFTVTIKGYGYEILDKKITLDLSSTSPENVLTQAVSGTSYSISANATGITLAKYKIVDRRKIVFSEMKEETGRFLRVIPSKTIYFEESGAIAKTKSYTSANSKVLKNERDPDQIINDIEVYGEDGSGNIVKGSASNSTSITNYGEKYKRYTFDFLTSDTEANAIASKLLVPNPVETIEIKIKRDFDLNLNEVIGITDSNRNISGDYIIFSLSHRSSKETIITVGSSVMAIARKEAKIRNTVEREEARLFSEETATADGTNVGSHTTNISGAVSSGTASVSDSGHSNHGVSGSTSYYTPSSVAGVSVVNATWTEASNSHSSCYIEENVVGGPTLYTTRTFWLGYNNSGSDKNVSAKVLFPSGSGDSYSFSFSNGYTHSWRSGESNSSNTSGWFYFYDNNNNSGIWVTGTAQNIYTHTHGSHRHGDGSLDTGTGTANVSDSGHSHNNTFTGDAQTFNLSLGLDKKIRVLNRKNR